MQNRSATYYVEILDMKQNSGYLQKSFVMVFFLQLVRNNINASVWSWQNCKIYPERRTFTPVVYITVTIRAILCNN